LKKSAQKTFDSCGIWHRPSPNPRESKVFCFPRRGAFFSKKKRFLPFQTIPLRPVALLTLRPSGTYRTAISWFSPRTLPVFCFDLSAPGRDNGAPRARIVQGKCLTYF
jgi:hypothetical protein